MDSKKECDSCGDCIKPQYLGTRKINITNVQNLFVEELGIKEMEKGVLEKKNLILKKFQLHDARDLLSGYKVTENKDYVEEEVTQEEREKYEKAIEDYTDAPETDENGNDIQYIEDIDGLIEMIAHEQKDDKCIDDKCIDDKCIVEEFPGLLKFDKDYRTKKNKKNNKEE